MFQRKGHVPRPVLVLGANYRLEIGLHFLTLFFSVDGARITEFPSKGGRPPLVSWSQLQLNGSLFRIRHVSSKWFLA